MRRKIVDPEYQLIAGNTYSIVVEFEGRDASLIRDDVITNNQVGAEAFRAMGAMYPGLEVRLLELKTYRLYPYGETVDGRLTVPDRARAIVTFKVLSNPNPITLKTVLLIFAGLAGLAIAYRLGVVIKSTVLYVLEEPLPQVIMVGGVLLVAVIAYRTWLK